MSLSESRRWRESAEPERKSMLPSVRWSRYPWPVFVLALGVLGTGVVLIHSMWELGQRFGHEDVSLSRHLRNVAAASPALLFGLALRPSRLRLVAPWLYGVCLVLLLLVPVIGIELNNAKRWIATPIGFDLQPSEFAKVGLILLLASLLHTRRLARWGEWFLPAAVALVPMGLVAVQPDLGTAMTIVPIFGAMAYLAGASGKRMLALIAAGALLLFGAVQTGAIQDYQLRRIETWARTFEAEPLIEERNGAPFHVYHARVSIGNGGWEGTGLGRGVATVSAHLPERESDSIFCVVAEEGGFLGAALFNGLYGALVALLLGVAASLRDRFSRLVVGGVAAYFGAHFFINAGVNLGLVPMTGLPLPLLSTGGSSLLASFGALGLALGQAAQQEPNLDADAFADG